MGDWGDRRLMGSSNSKKRIASLCMEIGLKFDTPHSNNFTYQDHHIPTYQGGLGELIGSMSKATADLGMPVDFFVPIYNKGNYIQHLDHDGWPYETDYLWYPRFHLKKLEDKIDFRLNGQDVKVNVWEKRVKGAKGYSSVYFFDLNDQDNPEEIRKISDHMYDGDHRIHQAATLGMCTVRFGEMKGKNYTKYHFNEGDPAFLVFELMNKGMNLEEIIDKCVFTTHTPVEAGLQRFAYDHVRGILGDLVPSGIERIAGDHVLNMSQLAINCSGYVNAVSKKHAEISKNIFNREFNYITNGIHAETWASEPLRKLFDKYCKGWRENSELLINAKSIPREEFWNNAYMPDKRRALSIISKMSGVDFDPNVLTLGISKRVTEYKRMDLLLDDLEELERIAGKNGLQIIYSGKTHPHDRDSKYIIKDKILPALKRLKGKVKGVYLPNYNIYLADLIYSASDVSVFTPLGPLEASSTSGMCYAVKGKPQIGTLDGWWPEGLIPGVTGWGIGKNNYKLIDIRSHEANLIRQEDRKELYSTIQNEVMPCFENKKQFAKMGLDCISINGSRFNAHRMMKQYGREAYGLDI